MAAPQPGELIAPIVVNGDYDLFDHYYGHQGQRIGLSHSIDTTDRHMM